MSADLDLLRLAEEERGDFFEPTHRIVVELGRIIGEMDHGANARAIAAFGGEQDRMTAASFPFMFGMVTDARRGRMPRRVLMHGPVLLGFLGERIVEMVRNRLFNL